MAYKNYKNIYTYFFYLKINFILKYLFFISNFLLIYKNNLLFIFILISRFCNLFVLFIIYCCGCYCINLLL